MGRVGKSMIKLLNQDCMLGLAGFDDNEFDLAIVDPPYGLHQFGAQTTGSGKLKSRKFNQGKIDTWDTVPTAKYFEELIRVSKNQIIWGGNYFDLPPTRCVICWDKCQPWENFSQWEMAWTSFNKPAPIFKYDNRTGGKRHPTQKPIELYVWLLDKFTNKGDKILDTHLGSGTIAIACGRLGFELTGYELNKDFYDDAVATLQEDMRQKSLFIPEQQLVLFDKNGDGGI